MATSIAKGCVCWMEEYVAIFYNHTTTHTYTTSVQFVSCDTVFYIIKNGIKDHLFYFSLHNYFLKVLLLVRAHPFGNDIDPIQPT